MLFHTDTDDIPAVVCYIVKDYSNILNYKLIFFSFNPEIGFIFYTEATSLVIIDSFQIM